MAARLRHIGRRIFCQISSRNDRAVRRLARAMRKVFYLWVILVSLALTVSVFPQIFDPHLDMASLRIPARGVSIQTRSIAGTQFKPYFESLELSALSAFPSLILSPPANLTAPICMSSLIQLQWDVSDGATQYHVERRRTITESYQVVGATVGAATSFTDRNVIAGASYLYRVRAVDSSGHLSVPSSTRLATALTFIDNPLRDPNTTPGTLIKAQHLAELRTAVNGVRAAAQLPAAAWSHPNLSNGLIYAADVEELRATLDEALKKIGLTPPTYTDTSLKGLVIRRVHIEELRKAVSWGGTEGGTENAPPSIRITSPADNSSFIVGGTIKISAAASDSDGSISKVEFYQGANKLGEVLAAPYDFSWSNVPAGPYSLIARAVDNNGAEASSSVAIVVNSGSSDSRLDPDNATGQPGEDLLSRNFNWNLPVVGLPGRSGHDLDISLSYNSLVWTKDASGLQITYDVDRGFPSPGFRLGFPVIEQKYLSSQTGKYTYLMITSSGARVELRQVGASNTYEAADSSYLQLTEGNGLVVRTSNGTQLQYFYLGGLYQCTAIKDRNGNIISINYLDDRINTVTDTAGRIVRFNYDSNGHLSSIKQQWTVDANTLRTITLASFTYTPQTIQTGLAGITVNGPPNGSQLSLLSTVSFPDNSSFEFVYNGWGQVHQIKRRAPDGHELARVAYTMDAPTQDCPRFTERRDYAENWNDGLEAVTTFSVPATLSWTMPDDGAAYTGKVGQVTLPDNTVTKVYYPLSGWSEGLPILTETVANSVTRRWARTKWTQDNEALDYPQNPRSIETITGDPEGNQKRTIVTYQDFPLPGGSNCYLPVDVAEGNSIAILRHRRTTYNMNEAYTSRRIVGLTDTVQLFEGTGDDILMSKVSYAYDEAGYLADQPNLSQHDANYGYSFVVGRGNLTGVQRWNVEHPDDNSYSVMSHIGYDTAGSVVSITDPSNHTTAISYADSYTDTSIAANSFAYPTTVKDASGYSSNFTYDYATGSMTKARNPLGAETVAEYDSAGRLKRKTVRDGVANTDVTYTRMEYLANGTEVQAYDLLDEVDEVKVESFSLQKLDGIGRVIGTADSHPSSLSGYRGTKISYDIMGRVSAKTNPAEITNPRGVAVSSWTPSGEDAVVGWQWNRQSYDWKGRPIKTTNADGSIIQASYGGCGCAGGELVTVTDERGRTQKTYHDALGRPVKGAVLNPNGTVYSATVNIYNARDQITFVREYKGAAVDESCPADTCKETSNTYDGHGRLFTAKGPEQDRPFKYSYNPDDTTDVIEDPRGVTLTYSYDARHLVEKLSYVVPNDPATGLPDAKIPSASTVEFSYDAVGSRRSMKDGTGWTDYLYNNLSQLKSEKRFFSDLAGTPSGGMYTLEYDYNRAGALKSIKDPFAHIDYSYNQAGELKGIKGAPFGGVSEYITDVKYRSWGALKEIAYGNHLKLSTEYDTGLRLKHFELNSATQVFRTGLETSTSMAMSIDYDYYGDGSLRFADDKLDNRFDRAYEYDHLGRIKEAYTDVRARKFMNPGNTESLRPEPYRQSYRFDEWSNLTWRNSQFWSQANDNFAVEYDSRNRITGREYDAAGNETLNTTTSLTYNAAGNNVKADSLTADVKNQQWFDGDGQVVKRYHAETEEVDGTTFTSEDTTYYLRSSVINGQVLVELAPWGGREKGYVYSGSTVIAVQNETGNSVRWQHRAPMTQSYGQSHPSGQYVHRSEFDPTGVDVRLLDPVIAPPTNQEDLGGAYFAGGKCQVDGMAIECAWATQMMETGVAVPCRDNDCGPRWNRNRDGRGHGGWEIFAPTLGPEGDWLAFGKLDYSNDPRPTLQRRQYVEIASMGFLPGDPPQGGSRRQAPVDGKKSPGQPGTRSGGKTLVEIRKEIKRMESDPGYLMRLEFERMRREMYPPKILAEAEKRWLDCATPINNRYVASRNSTIRQWNNTARVGISLAVISVLASRYDEAYQRLLNYGGAAANGAVTLSTVNLEEQLMDSLNQERAEREKECGMWPGKGFPSGLKGWDTGGEP